MITDATDVSARLARLGRWPGRVRRLAALACLLLAAATALSAQHSPSARPSSPATGTTGNPIAARLRPGQVAVPIRVDATATSGFVRAGDRIDLYAGSEGSALGDARCAAADSPVAATLPVLAAPTAADPDGPGRLIVATDRSTAARLAALHGCAMIAVLDKSP